jgi:hypothetical protein
MERGTLASREMYMGCGLLREGVMRDRWIGVLLVFLVLSACTKGGSPPLRPRRSPRGPLPFSPPSRISSTSGNSGLIDLGPLVGLWYLTVALRIGWSMRWVEEHAAAGR